MSNTYTLSTREYVILSAAMGGDLHLGFEDPFTGYLVEEINEVVESEVIPDLREKSLLLDQEGDTYQVDPSLESLLWNVVFPSVSLLVNQYASGGVGNEGEILHFSPEGIVLQHGENSDIHLCLMNLADWKHWISKRVAGQTESLPGGQTLVLNEDIFQKAEAQASQDLQEAERMIAEAGVNQESARALAESLRSFKRRIAFVAVHRDPQHWKVDGFAFLEGGDGYWSLHPIQRDEGNWVEMKPSSGEEIRKRFDVWLKEQGLPMMDRED